MKALLLGIVWLSFTQVAFACANFTGSGTKYNGDYTSGARMYRILRLRHSLTMSRAKDGAQLEAELRSATNFNDRSDYSIALMYLGRSGEAIPLLERLEKEEPGHYFIAANLGTAYELAGDNEDALRWINEGIRRNPDSHEGTEWLHAKILEAKIKQQTDADYFKKHSVLDLRPDQVGGQIVVGDRKLSPQDVADAIQHQLEERLQFVKPPDAAVASLLFDYAAIEAATVTLESAEKVLQLAVEYGYPSEQVQPLVKLYHERIVWRKTRGYAGGLTAGAAVIGLLWWLYRRRVFVISRRDLKSV